MASTPHWVEYNVASTSTAGSRAEANWKAVDDSTTAYSASPVTAGNYSYQKIQALVFDTGSWNNLSVFSYKINSNSTSPDAGWSVYGTTISAWTAPVSTAVDATLMSLSGINANFVAYSSSVPGNIFAGGTSTAASTPNGNTWIGTNLLRTQLKTTSNATPGDITQVTITATWTES